MKNISEVADKLLESNEPMSEIWPALAAAGSAIGRGAAMAGRGLGRGAAQLGRGMGSNAAAPVMVPQMDPNAQPDPSAQPMSQPAVSGAGDQTLAQDFGDMVQRLSEPEDDTEIGGVAPTDPSGGVARPRPFNNPAKKAYEDSEVPDHEGDNQCPGCGKSIPIWDGWCDSCSKKNDDHADARGEDETMRESVRSDFMGELGYETDETHPYDPLAAWWDNMSEQQRAQWMNQELRHTHLIAADHARYVWGAMPEDLQLKIRTALGDQAPMTESVVVEAEWDPDADPSTYDFQNRGMDRREPGKMGSQKNKGRFAPGKYRTKEIIPRYLFDVDGAEAPLPSDPGYDATDGVPVGTLVTVTDSGYGHYELAGPEGEYLGDMWPEQDLDQVLDLGNMGGGSRRESVSCQSVRAELMRQLDLTGGKGYYNGGDLMDDEEDEPRDGQPAGDERMFMEGKMSEAVPVGMWSPTGMREGDGGKGATCSNCGKKHGYGTTWCDDCGSDITDDSDDTPDQQEDHATVPPADSGDDYDNTATRSDADKDGSSEPKDNPNYDTLKKSMSKGVKQTSEMSTSPDPQEQIYFDYLDQLRDSGVTNMMGASQYLQSEFGLDRNHARSIHSDWMKNYSDDRNTGGPQYGKKDNPYDPTADFGRTDQSDDDDWDDHWKDQDRDGPRTRRNEMSTSPDPMDQEYFDYLDQLRDSGVTNMMGAGPYLQSEFGMDRQEARRIHGEWMRNYSADRNTDGPQYGKKDNPYDPTADFGPRESMSENVGWPPKSGASRSFKHGTDDENNCANCGKEFRDPQSRTQVRIGSKRMYVCRGCAKDAPRSEDKVGGLDMSVSAVKGMGDWKHKEKRKTDTEFGGVKQPSWDNKEPPVSAGVKVGDTVHWSKNIGGVNYQNREGVVKKVGGDLETRTVTVTDSESDEDFELNLNDNSCVVQVLVPGENSKIETAYNQCDKCGAEVSADEHLCTRCKEDPKAEDHHSYEIRDAAGVNKAIEAAELGGDIDAAADMLFRDDKQENLDLFEVGLENPRQPGMSPPDRPYRIMKEKSTGQFFAVMKADVNKVFGPFRDISELNSEMGEMLYQDDIGDQEIDGRDEFDDAPSQPPPIDPAGSPDTLSQYGDLGVDPPDPDEWVQPPEDAGKIGPDLPAGVRLMGKDAKRRPKPPTSHGKLPI